MDDYTFAEGLLQRTSCFRVEEPGRRIFCGEDGLSASERYQLLSLIYRRLEGERYPDSIGKLTFYTEETEGYLTIGLFDLQRDRPVNWFCFAAVELIKKFDKC